MSKLLDFLLVFGMLGSVLSGSKKANADQHEVKDEMKKKKATTGIATFAGGCFWCSEADFKKLPGVEKVVSGYAGGEQENPTYQEVCSGKTNHVEAVQIHYDSAKVTYEELIDAFWRHIDPTDSGGQFVDRGPQYKSLIFYHDGEQKRLAEKSKAALSKSGRFTAPIATEIKRFTTFYEAEEYHQNYHKKSPLGYRRYRSGSGRDRFIGKVWGGKEETVAETAGSYTKPDDAALRETLTPLQYDVTQHDDTERAFQNEYWDNKGEGIYVDIVSGEPLFSSHDKFESGTGWPSFTKPLEPEHIVEKEDGRLFMKRVEVRSKNADSHLGHVFPDGPEPTGLRYCINSAALRFIPKDNLEEEGYGQYASLFDAG